MSHVHRKVITALLALLLAPAAVAESPAYDQLPDDRVLYIAPGQSLAPLVERLYPDRPADWGGIRDWIVRNNPHAFVDGDPGRLRADVRVRLPSGSALAADDPYRPAPSRTAGDTGGRAFEFGERFVFVDPAQSLSQLVPQLYPNQHARWDAIVAAIIDRNSDRLAEADAQTRIRRGTRLRIPEVSGSGPVTPAAPAPADSAEAPAPDEPVVAEVVAHTGDLYAADAADQRHDLGAGDPVRRGDTLHTGDAGRAEIEFRDGERIYLRPDSRLHVRAWRLPETGPGNRVVELIRGGLRAITGAIGNRDGDTYRTVTPQATLGVRGTEYTLRVCADDECRLGGADTAALQQGLYVGVDRGRVSLLNETGEAAVAAGELRYVAGPSAEPVPADADVRGVLYTAADQAARPEAAAADAGAAAEAEDEGTHWGWIVLGIVLLGAGL